MCHQTSMQRSNHQQERQPHTSANISPSHSPSGTSLNATSTNSSLQTSSMFSSDGVNDCGSPTYQPRNTDHFIRLGDRLSLPAQKYE